MTLHNRRRKLQRSNHACRIRNFVIYCTHLPSLFNKCRCLITNVIEAAFYTCLRVDGSLSNDECSKEEAGNCRESEVRYLSTRLLCCGVTHQLLQQITVTSSTYKPHNLFQYEGKTVSSKVNADLNQLKPVICIKFLGFRNDAVNLCNINYVRAVEIYFGLMANKM